MGLVTPPSPRFGLPGFAPPLHHGGCHTLARAEERRAEVFGRAGGKGEAAEIDSLELGKNRKM